MFVVCIQKLSKIDQTSIKNRSKIQPKSTQNRSWRRLGGVLEAKVSPVRILERLDGQHGSILAPKTEPKSIKNRTKKPYKFQCLLESIFSWILIEKTSENGTLKEPPTAIFLDLAVLLIFEGCP